MVCICYTCMNTTNCRFKFSAGPMVCICTHVRILCGTVFVPKHSHHFINFIESINFSGIIDNHGLRNKYYCQMYCLFVSTDMKSKRYMCKAPSHQLFLDTLVDVFPDATLIYTYRPLTQVLPSSFSMHKYIIEPSGYNTESEQFRDR